MLRFDFQHDRNSSTEQRHYTAVNLIILNNKTNISKEKLKNEKMSYEFQTGGLREIQIKNFKIC